MDVGHVALLAAASRNGWEIAAGADPSPAAESDWQNGPSSGLSDPYSP
jgi:hypothetical protein